MPIIAKRAEEIAPFIVMEVLERAWEMERRGIDIIHLEVGEPDFDIPPAVKAATCRALDDGLTHYTHSLGDMALRETICEHYLRTYGASVHPDQVVVTGRRRSPKEPGLFSSTRPPIPQETSSPRASCRPSQGLSPT